MNLNDTYNIDVVILALGSWPRQKGLKSAGQEECEKEDTLSQVSSFFGNWNPSGLLNLQRTIAKIKTPHIEELFISLESYCLKWAHMTRLDICNTSYGKKKGWESNW